MSNIVTKKARASDGPVSENHQFAMTSQGPRIVALAKAQRTGNRIALRSPGCCPVACVVGGELLSTQYHLTTPLWSVGYITITKISMTIYKHISIRRCFLFKNRRMIALHLTLKLMATENEI
jgi:hypothetical protein